MTFLELLKKLEAHLGSHQLPLNAAATGIKNVFESIPLHHQLMQRLVQAIYKENRCQHLHDSVDRETTFEAVVPLRLEVLRSDRTDVDLYRFIEEFCVALDRSFGPVARPIVEREPTGTAEVIEFARFRRRLKSLA